MQEIIVFVCVNEIIVFIVTLFIVWVVVTGWSFFVTGGMQGYIYPKLLPLCLYWFSWSLWIFLLVICYSLLGSFRTKVLPCVWSRLCILLRSGSRLPLAPCCRSYINVRYLAQPVSGICLFRSLVCVCWFSALLFRASCSGISPRLGTSPVRNRFLFLHTSVTCCRNCYLHHSGFGWF